MDNFVSVGIQLPLIISFWIFIGLLVLAVGSFFLSGGDDYSGFWITAWLAFWLAMFALIIWLIMLVPFQSKYHQIYRVSGDVTEVSNVFTESGSDLTRTPVLTIKGIDRDITMSDPRSVNLKGKHVELTCTVGWNYQAADTYSCKIYAIK